MLARVDCKNCKAVVLDKVDFKFISERFDITLNSACFDTDKLRVTEKKKVSYVSDQQ
jgi:hypothetical protein